MSFLINQYIQNVAITRHLRMLSLETLRAFFINQLINHPFKSFLSTGAMNGSEMKNSSELCDGTGIDLINSKEKCLKTELLLSVFYSTQISHFNQDTGQILHIKHTKKNKSSMTDMSLWSTSCCQDSSTWSMKNKNNSIMEQIPSSRKIFFIQVKLAHAEQRGVSSSSHSFCCWSSGIITITSPSITTLSLTEHVTAMKANDILILWTSASASTSSPM